MTPNKMETMHVLVVDDEPPIRRRIEIELGTERRRISAAESVRTATALLKRDTFDVVLLDMRLPDGDGLEILAQLQEIAPEVQAIVITGYGEVDNAVRAMKLGAYDYIAKPFDLDRLALIIEKAYQRTCLARENRLLRRSQPAQIPPRLVGQSAALENVRFLIRKVAPARAPVLLTGESGTGKNVVAQLIHELSERNEQSLMAYNWPGNVRELQYVLEHGMILAEDDLITEQCLPLDLAGWLPETCAGAPFPPLKEVERQHIMAVLQFTEGCRTRAAEILGIGRKTLYRKLGTANRGPAGPTVARKTGRTTPSH